MHCMLSQGLRRRLNATPGKAGINSDEECSTSIMQPFRIEWNRKQTTIPTPRRQSAQPKKREAALNAHHAKNIATAQEDASAVRYGAIPFFIANVEQVFDEWVSMLSKTSLPGDISSSDPFVLTTFHLLDSMMDGGESIRSRFAHLQLLRAFKTLEEILDRERQNQPITRKRGLRNSSVALAIYGRAHPTVKSRRDLSQRKQAAECWRTPEGPSPFFLVLYSESTDAIAWVCLSSWRHLGLISP